jgi:serine/threonine protein kinase/tetratricopeptide (TPR) repeat protein
MKTVTPPLRTCPKCGAPLTSEVVGGLCPGCVAALALATEPDPQEVPAASVPVTEKPGDRIGHYKLLQQIGEGGCGVVYLAQQEAPVRRQVAFKIIKLGMDTRNVIARFEAERQALALMDHPNIAKVLDAGATAAGRPFFVMELVRGVKITEYCDANQISTRQRLELFVQVCQAIQHAHQKGVIHRDIKPSNILVTLRDGAPVPKVIDFGIAKATTDQLLTDKTVFTEYRQFLGTPVYMSPEQAEMSELGIDTRSDIYSLGILLYELLTGTTPFETRDLLRAGLDEMRRVIREREPMRPSTRLSTMLAGQLGATARQRRTEPPRLVSLVRGDLDWIVMMALEKDRARRYETANGLAMDVLRHLQNEPVVARPPTPGYRFRKLVRRNKLVCAATAAVAGALCLGLGLSTWLLFKERAARQRAVAAELQARQARTNEAAQRRQADEARALEARLRQQAQTNEHKAQIEADKSKELARLYKRMLQGVRPSKALGRDTTMVREMLEQAVSQTAKELTNQPEVTVEIRLRLADTYDELGLYAQEEALARECLELARAKIGQENQSVADSLLFLGSAKIHFGQLEEAEQVIRQGLAIRRKLHGDEHEEVAWALNSLACVLHEEGKLSEAETAQCDALMLLSKLAGSEDEVVTMYLNNLGSILSDQGKYDEAESMYREALTRYRKLFGNQHPDVANTLANLGIVLMERGELAEAETLLRESVMMYRTMLGNEHPDVALALQNLANVLCEAEKFPEAESLMREALALNRRLFGEEHFSVAGCLNDLGNIMQSQRKLVEAERLYRQAMPLHRKLYGDSHWFVAHSTGNLGNVLFDEGKFAEAETLQREALAIYRKVLGEEHLEVARTLGNLANALGQQGKHAEAVPMLQDALARHRKILGPDHLENAVWLKNLGYEFLEQHELPEAEAAFREALAIKTKSLGTNDSALYEPLDRLGQVLRCEGKLAESESRYRQALALQKRLLGDDHPDVLTALTRLAHLLEAEGEPAEAAALYGTELASALARFNSLAPDDPRRSDLAIAAGHWYWRVAEVLSGADQFEPAAACLREALRVFEQGGRDFPAQLYLGQEQAYTRRQLAEALTRMGQVDEAERHQRAAVALYGDLKTVAPTNSFYWKEEAFSAWMLGLLLEGAGRRETANSAYRQAILLHQKAATAFPDDRELSSRLAQLLHNKGPSAGVEGAYRLAAEQYRKLAAGGDPGDLNALAWFLATCPDATMRDGSAAVTLANQAVEANKRAEEQFLDTLAAACAAAGQFAEAARVEREAIAAIRSDLEARLKEFSFRLQLYESGFAYLDTGDRSDTAAALHALADLRNQQGKPAEAEPLYRQAWEVRKRLWGNDDADTAGSAHNLADVLAQQNKLAEAEDLYRTAWTARRKVLGLRDPSTLGSLHNLADALAKQSKRAEAESLRLEELALRNKVGD